jgi:AraC-like DNA-binding protein
MPLLLDTASVEPEHRADVWREAHPRYFFPAEVRVVDPAFSGRICGHQVGPLRLFRIEAGPGGIRRTWESIARGDPESLNVGLQLRGRAEAQQAERRVLLAPGDLSSWDTSQPFSIQSDEPHEMLLVFVPRTLLGAYADRMCARTAQHTPGDRGIGAVIAPFLRSLWAQLDERAPVLPRQDLAESALGLVRAMHMSAHERSGPGAEPSGRALVVRMKTYVDEHLSDPGLGPESVARAHFVSTRYVHKLFAAERLTLSRWILQRRLERIRRDLLDPDLSDDTISTIGRWWGLPNASHLSQLFRRQYGCAPREMRAVGARPPR